MSKIEVNTVAPQCGTTLTLGESGDTVTLGTGASQSGFGRNGSVNWQTSIKTANFTAVSSEGYFCDTATTGAFTLTLPSSPSVGDIVALKDYAGNFATANLTIGRAGSNLNGSANDSVRDTNNESLTLVYADATKGWLAVEEGTGYVGERFIAATGGTTTTCGDFKIHTFTGPGTFTVSQTASTPACNAVEYIVVGGGGGGGRPNSSGGGGGGGFRFASPSLAPATYPGKPLAAPAGLPVSAQSYPVVIGGGGAVGVNPGNAQGSNGNISTFSTLTGAGGGGGGGEPSPISGTSSPFSNTGVGTPTLPGHSAGGPGGSGGGSRGTQSNPGSPQPANHYFNPGGVPNAGGTGNTPPVSPSQGNAGGSGYDGVSCNSSGGGGGGAMAVGNSARGPGQGTNAGGPGGDGAGIPTAFGANGQPCGSFRYYAGGGGGGTDVPAPSPGASSTGGKGGGGAGAINPGDATPGTANTGGGGGSPGGPGSSNSGTGGSGIVIIRYKFQ